MNAEAGIIYTKISDHLPYFLSIRLNETEDRQEGKKYIKKCTYTKEAMSSFLNEMISEEIHATMDHNPYADPNENFNILSTHTPFVPCQSAIPFLRYNFFQNLTLKILGQGHGWGER